ncbi:MAG: S41 family peptidase [Bdellovibrionia bacterium]
MVRLISWFLSLTFFLSLAGPLQAATLTEEERLSDFNQLVGMIKSGYGPVKYKQSALGIDINKLSVQYTEKIKAVKTNGDFYYLMVEFVAEFKDSHFSAAVPTTHGANLPFTTDLVEGRVLVDAIDRSKLDEATFPFSRGDEILEVDGVSIGDVLKALARRRGMGFEQSALRYAAMSITSRAGTVFNVPTGEVTFKIRRGISTVIESVKLKWNVKGAPLDESGPMEVKPFASFGSNAGRNYDMLTVDIGERRTEKDFRCSGSTRIAIPEGATVIMKTPEAPFVAYYHPTTKGNIGYLRIPHYYPMNELTGKPEYEERFAQYEYAISVLEKNTVGLIIDQDHNCGGSVDYLHRMVGLFVPGSFKPMQFQLLASKQEYMDFSKYVEETPKFSIAFESVKKVVELIRSNWVAGKHMTPVTSIDGIEALHHNHIRYSKPIVMLIDEMSGSGGDAFPSLLQGYKRAKLLGTRTMGAGGHVVEQAPLHYSRLMSRMTKSLFYRPDEVAVENNGAAPDVPYTITRDDFMYGYKNYQAFYLSKLLEMIQ